MVEEWDGKIAINPAPVGHSGGFSGSAEYVIMQLVQGRLRFKRYNIMLAT